MKLVRIELLGQGVHEKQNKLNKTKYTFDKNCWEMYD